ncbi:MAG: thiamine phosphate synthase [Butyrivibrio sp.]|nr:thiamine phosphate synthase [Butyrivibrio sp.]
MQIEREALRLYAVTDRRWIKRQTFEEAVEKAILGGVTMVQLREKELDKTRFLQEALALRTICHKYGILLLINDDVEICRLAGADGVHIGQEDMEIHRARAVLGDDKIIGVTVHNVIEAVHAQQAGADYLGAGAAFGSTTKKDAHPISRADYCNITANVQIPVVAIGGICAENIEQLCGCGLSGAAVISGIFAQSDIEQAAREIRVHCDRMNWK